MAFFEYKNARIAGIAAGVPKNILKNEGNVVQSKDYDAAAFVELTGVAERRFSYELTTSDLAYQAAEKLIADLGWDKAEISALIFCSQSADYKLPATACILQDRLGLSKECYASDMTLGCSGWVYGLSQAVSLLVGNSLVDGPKRALFLCGDAGGGGQPTGKVKPDPLFGHCGTATAIEIGENLGSLEFHFGTDGSGFDAIIKPDGGGEKSISSKFYGVL